MFWVAVVGVLVCVAFALQHAFRGYVALRALATPAEGGVWSQALLAVQACRDLRKQQSLLNELTLDVDANLKRWANLGRAPWRICLGAGVAALALTAQREPLLSVALVAFGAAGAWASWLICALAERTRKRARQLWEVRLEQLRTHNLGAAR